MRYLEYRLARATHVRSRRRPVALSTLLACLIAGSAALVADGFSGGSGRIATAERGPARLSGSSGVEPAPTVSVVRSEVSARPTAAWRDGATPGLLFAGTSLTDAAVPIDGPGIGVVGVPARSRLAAGGAPDGPAAGRAAGR